MKKHLQQTTKIDAKSRRAPLLQWNESQEAGGNTCAACPGTCCTFVANSVRVTPVEALDLVGFLKSAGQWNDHLFEHLRVNEKKYGLDRPMVGDGRRVFGRRRYTCPFFGESKLGCPFPREVKPYGCLGFHPNKPRELAGDSCAANQEVLENREKTVPDESKRNAELVSILDWEYPSLPLPTALLAIQSYENQPYMHG